MPITITQAVTLPFPEIPYDKVLISFACSNRVEADNSIEASMSATLIPYRVLPDGTVDQRPDKAITRSYGSVFAEAATNPVIAQAMGGLVAIFQAFIVAEGI